ncbi:extracellular solute-binding protein [Paenibacillus thalictri]|uniref:Extracellular solute-binding protein n=1 Tax=Paenibacillus thalictri TaxID=2527873 RepID=A0A4Q9DV55_9BACL|nr:extracellular solute-binding protein [Paenibacillus thalictri]TBL79478.1 extracellular solute-binding protein [Paenibacillus thalictri]
MNKKVSISVSAVTALSLVLLSACTSDKAGQEQVADANRQPAAPSNLNASGFPIVKQPLTMSAMVLLSPSQPTNWNDILAWQEYEKMTGIHIDWKAHTSADITEKRNLALASNQLPDIFYRTKTPDSDVDKYGAEGSFMKLNGLIDQYAPNFKALMQKYNDVRKGVQTADGSIYAMPYLTDSPSIEITSKLFLNQEWLKKTGKKLPTTTDELTDVLTAFRDGDPNGNGKQDEVPLTSDTLDKLIWILRGSFGLANKGVGNENWDVDPKSGKLRFFPASEGYKELMAYMRKLYENKLIDQEIFTNDGKKVLAKNEQNQIGAFAFGNIVALANKNANDFVGLGTALAGPHGDRLFTSARGHFGAKGAFMISSSNKNPEAAMRWIDYFYGEEGIRMLYMGIEGTTYQKDSSGNYDFIPKLTENIPAGSSFDQVISKYVPYAGGSLPTIILEKYFKGGETQPAAKAAAENLQPYLPKELWAPFGFTAQESADKQSLEADINGLVKQRTAEFIQGKVSIDKFDDYVAQLNKMGLGDLQKMYETAYERYKK